MSVLFYAKEHIYSYDQRRCLFAMRQDENMNCHDIIVSEDYVDIFARFNGDIEEEAKRRGAVCPQRIFEDWVIFRYPLNGKTCEDFYFNSEYVNLPNVYGLCSINSIEAAGIGPVLRNPSVDLQGNGIIIGIIDTGIDYLHEAFRYEDNTTKIMSIWDQSVEGTPPEDFIYGAEFTQEQINEALKSDDPYSIVNSKDEIGHGTFIAGVAAGRPNKEAKFTGVATNASLIVVKLKQAKECVRKFYQIKDGAAVYQTNDIGEAILYIQDKAYSQKINQPLVLLSSLSSSDGPHNGNNELERFFAGMGTNIGTVVVTPGGNEANSAHHYRGKFMKDETIKTVDLNIADNEGGIFINTWVYLPDKLTFEIISPSGETTGKIPYQKRKWQTFNLDLESSIIHIYYDFIEERSAEESMLLIIHAPLPGLWQIKVYGDFITDGRFDMYLPIRTFIDKNTVFLSPSPDNTVTMPATNRGTVTVGAYNDVVNSIYLPSGRGYTRAELIVPDIVAPGVNILGPYPNNQYGTQSGTSAAAAIVGGASALLLEWGLIKGNDPVINTIVAKTYFIRGARRRKGIDYPNREWGYGELDLVNTLSTQ